MEFVIGQLVRLRENYRAKPLMPALRLPKSDSPDYQVLPAGTVFRVWAAPSAPGRHRGLKYRQAVAKQAPFAGRIVLLRLADADERTRLQTWCVPVRFLELVPTKATNEINEAV